MIYRFARFLCRLAFPFFVNKRLVAGLQNVPHDRPVLLASNHPNSFFDAVVIGVYLQRPIYTLTRADVFRKPLVAKLLRGINLIPVFRSSEGGSRDNVANNDQTFEACQQVFKKNGIVVIFVEGICLNQTKLLPLKKGVARIAQQGWSNPEIGDKLVIIPTGLWYSSFNKLGKDVALRFGKPISMQDMPTLTEPIARELNQKLNAELQPLIVPFARDSSVGFQVQIGKTINFPVNALCQYVAHKFTHKTVFYDSVLFGLLMVAWPIYWILLACLVLCCTI